MKSPYEIAWNLLEEWNYGSRTDEEKLSKITGLTIEEISRLKTRYTIAHFLCCHDLSVVKKVIKEIEQVKPHWEIGDV